MLHHLKFYLTCVKLSIISELEFRANFIINLVSDFSWLGAGLFTLYIAFSQLRTIGGWQREEVQLLLLVNTYFVDLLWALTLAKIAYFSDLIRLGTFDFILTKPLNSRFVVSFASILDVTLSQMLKQLFLFILIIIFIIWLNISVTLFQWLQFFLFIFLGFVIFYSLGFIITTLNVWVVRLDNVHWLMDTVIDAGKNPLSVWKGIILYVFSWLIPLGFTANFATRSLLSREPQIQNIIVGVIIALFLFVLSDRLWKFAITH